MQYHDIEQLYKDFVTIVLNIVSVSVPCKLVTLGPKEPHFVTTTVKMLLKQCYRLHRRACYADANAVAQKTNAIIISVNKSAKLKKLSNATSRDQ